MKCLSDATRQRLRPTNASLHRTILTLQNFGSGSGLIHGLVPPSSTETHQNTDRPVGLSTRTNQASHQQQELRTGVKAERACFHQGSDPPQMYGTHHQTASFAPSAYPTPSHGSACNSCAATPPSATRISAQSYTPSPVFPESALHRPTACGLTNAVVWLQWPQVLTAQPRKTCRLLTVCPYCDNRGPDGSIAARNWDSAVNHWLQRLVFSGVVNEQLLGPILGVGVPSVEMKLMELAQKCPWYCRASSGFQRSIITHSGTQISQVPVG